MEAARSTSHSLIEQRRLPRLHLKASVQFRDISKPSTFFTGCLCKNVSASGLCLRTEVFLPRKSRWVILVSVPSASREPIRLIGRVAWSAQQPFGRTWECGIQFIEVADEDKRVIADFVERGVVRVVS